MHGGNWGGGSGAGGFSIGLSGNRASDIGSRSIMPDGNITRKVTWREFFREMIAVAGCVLAFLSVLSLIMLMNERYGIVPALLTIIIILMVFSPRKE